MTEKQMMKRLDGYVREYGLKEEVDAWIDYFNANRRRISVSRYATFVKAALTGKATLRIGRSRAIELVDEINTFVPKELLS